MLEVGKAFVNSEQRLSDMHPYSLYKHTRELHAELQLYHLEHSKENSPSFALFQGAKNQQTKILSYYNRSQITKTKRSFDYDVRKNRGRRRLEP